MSGPLVLVLAVIGGVLAARDPRRLLPGVLLVVAAASLATTLIGGALDTTSVLVGLDDGTRAIVGGMMILVVPSATGLALGLGLLANGVTMLRRERAMLSNALSLVSGVAVLALLALWWAAILAGWLPVVLALLVIVVPIAYLGVGLVAYLVWSLVYARTARRATSPAAIVVLGSGLVDGRVPPLLAQRVDLGVAMQIEHPDAVLVLSGGQGPDEPRSEAEAMAEHAASRGAPGDAMLTERASTTTEENLRMSEDLLAQRGARGSVLVVTSDYHAFRAATLLRRLGMIGHAVGARTAGYYRPSALLREYVALLRDHMMGNVIALGLLVLPVAALCVLAFAGRP